MPTEARLRFPLPSGDMSAQTRKRSATELVVALIGVLLAITGLQKVVLSPVLGWLSDLSTPIQLVLLLGAVVAVAGAAVLISRRSRRELRAATAVANASLAGLA